MAIVVRTDFLLALFCWQHAGTFGVGEAFHCGYCQVTGVAENRVNFGLV